MSDLADSNDLLHRMLTGKDTYHATAENVKNFNMLQNMIKNPDTLFYWSDPYVLERSW